MKTKDEPVPAKFNSDNKQSIRNNWAKPLLAYLHETLGKKLIYLGLPDTQATDVKEWIEYIDSVFAFQCRDYPHPSDPSQSRDNVIALEDTLRTLERRKQLVTFDVFDGYIEEVILRGYDNTPTTKHFVQQDTITIYNLDFCGQVTSPIEYTDRDGVLKKAFKFNAVDRLMNFQRNISFPEKKFIMFLTLHCSYDGKEFEKFVSNPPNTDIKNYIGQISSFKKAKKAPYLVKAFVHHNLTHFFTQNHFIPEFLPTIHYQGDNNHPLLFFTIIGNQVENSSGVATPLQNFNNILNKPFISVSNDSAFEQNLKLKLDNEADWGNNLNPIHLFKDSKTYKNHWK